MPVVVRDAPKGVGEKIVPETLGPNRDSGGKACKDRAGRDAYAASTTT
jgi:hypothetical protein